LAYTTNQNWDFNIVRWQFLWKTPQILVQEETQMKYGRVYNFSAGPAMMPEEVLEEIASEVMNYRGSGMSASWR
jgi:hypothetical protein